MTFSRAILFCTQFSHSQLYKNAEMEITSNEIVTHPCRSTRNSIVNPRYSTKESIHDQHGEFFFFHTQSQVKNATGDQIQVNCDNQWYYIYEHYALFGRLFFSFKSHEGGSNRRLRLLALQGCMHSALFFLFLALFCCLPCAGLRSPTFFYFLLQYSTYFA